MNSNWTVISGHLQGDISYSLRKVLTTPSYVDFELTTFGETWQEFDIAFEYRVDDRSEWQDNAVITQTTAKYLRGNKLYGLTLSKYGETHSIQWKYSENNLFYNNTLQLRFRILPRIKVFSTAGEYNQISSAYGDSLINFEGQSRHTSIGVNKSGQYMCIDSTSFYILDSLDGDEVYTYSGLNNSNYAIQINNGHYIISDYGNSRIIEMDATLSTILKSYSMGGVVYFDYSESNETLLITSETLNVVREITWSNIDTGTAIWQSSYSLSSPQCATYQQNDVTKIVIADTGNNRIVKCNRLTSTYETLYHYQVGSGTTYEISLFYKPYRIYQYSDGNICVVEQQGKPLDFEMIASSSSSSSESSSSSSADIIWLEDGDELWTEGGIIVVLE